MIEINFKFLVTVSQVLFFVINRPLMIDASSPSPKDSTISITESNLEANHVPGELIFEDNFDALNLETWMHEKTLGTKDWEFQMYSNSRTNSYVHDGILFIRPTLTCDSFDVSYVYNGSWYIEGRYPEDMCTDPTNYGCNRKGKSPNVLPPVMSAKMKTVESFYFKYGRVEVRAKVPSGDWIWQVVGMMPRFNGHGAWPASGQINIIRSLGNQELYEATSGENVGVKMITSALHFGPIWPLDGWEMATAKMVSPPGGKGFDQDFHIYGITWTDEKIEFTMDGNVTKIIEPSEGGFWELGEFDNLYPNPWKNAANKNMAPFDQKFYLVMNVAVGGGYNFPDDWINKKGKKPWNNDSPKALLNFFEARDVWFPTWEGEAAALQVDYVRVYAI